MSETDNFDEIVRSLGVEDVRSAADSLRAIHDLGIPQDLFQVFIDQLPGLLVRIADRDRVLVSLHRFLDASRSPQSWLSLFERESDCLPTLLRLFSISQYVADSLITDPEVFDLLRMTEGQPVDRGVLLDEILTEVSSASDTKSAMRILRVYRHRETLRIAYGDFVLGQPIDTVFDQISILADCIVQTALVVAKRELAAQRRAPVHLDGKLIQFAVVALGKLGGAELNYSSDIDLVFIRESCIAPLSWQNSHANEAGADEYFQRLGQLVIKLLSESTSAGIAYRVDMRLRPHGSHGPLVVSVDEAVRYYDTAGRTWERQAFIKARPIAGDFELATAFVDDLQPWIYRRYLMRADITGIAALKRRIEQHAKLHGDDERNIKLGRGGIRDIEYVIQFLQLLHGPELPSVRVAATLEAIRKLQAAGCITAEEQSILEDNYRYLRHLEHHLQIMFDRKTHTLPSDDFEFDRLALRMWEVSRGDSLLADGQAGQALRKQLKTRTDQNRQILDHLLHDAFASYGYEGNQNEQPVCDLLLDPEPAPDLIRATLQPYGFADDQAAYRHLQELAVESISFLSTRRSRHFLVAIAPKLLAAIATTPNPDATLISLVNVSASLGGKAVLWELFSVNPPSMELCVRLCASSPYLAGILTGNPGMIDELLDSLMLDSLPSHEELAQDLDALCRGAVEISPMLNSFKSSMHLRVGVRDILGKSSITETHAALSDIAEVCMEKVIHSEFHRLIHQLGIPVTTTADGTEQAAELVVLAVGKLGGREPNYHSDLDVMFLFAGEGNTKSLVPVRRFESTTNRHFFNQLCQRVIQTITRIGSTGRLYDLDVRLRPLGRSGLLAISIEDFQRYFTSGSNHVWERQALCKARPIWGSPSAKQDAMKCVRDALTSAPFAENDAQQIYDHRWQLQSGAADGNLKRGMGGTMDIEFVVQLLQLAYVAEKPEVLVPGTLAAIDRLAEAGAVNTEVATSLRHHYQFLRRVESSIRLMNLSARHELPSDPVELGRLAFLLKSEHGASLDGPGLAEMCKTVRSESRAIFNETFSQWLPTNVAE